MCVMTDDAETPQYAWDKQKNAWLRSERGFGFEDVVLALEEDGPLDDISHPNPKHLHHDLAATVEPSTNDIDLAK